jgi:hypothetical protein
MSFSSPLKFSQEDKKKYHNFLMSLKDILPCRACRDNYAKNLSAINYSEDDLEGRRSFSLFIYRLHNCVNNMLGKPCSMTYEQVRDRYELFRARCVEGVPNVPKHSKLKKKESGCMIPMTGIKSRVVINIVPFKKKVSTFNVDKDCIPKLKKYL